MKGYQKNAYQGVSENSFQPSIRPTSRQGLPGRHPVLRAPSRYLLKSSWHHASLDTVQSPIS